MATIGDLAANLATANIADNDRIPIHDISAATGAKDKYLTADQVPEYVADAFSGEGVVELLIADRIRSEATGAMDDNTFVSFAAPMTAGVFIIYCVFSPEQTARRNSTAIVAYDASLPACHILWQPGSEVEARTGVLNGTTGSDGVMTVSAVNGYIYVENRQGFTIADNILFLG